MTTYGTFETVAGRGALVFRRELEASGARAWTALTTPAGLAAWFPCRVDGDLTTVGADLDFVFPGDGSGGADTTHGTVLAVDPGRRLVLTWETEELRIEVEPLGAERCAVDFVNLLPVGDDSTAARTAAGWHACLDALGAHLATGAVAPPPADPTEQFRSVYAHYVAAGFPSGAPLPGDDDA